MFSDHRLARKLPGEIKIELLSAQDAFMPRVKEIVNSVEADDSGPLAWSESLRKYLAEGDAMIVGARIGRSLVGFLVLEQENAASFSWVADHARDRGLGCAASAPMRQNWGGE